MTKSRILFKAAFGEFASDWEERTDLELQNLHASVQMILKGKADYIWLISKKSRIYLSEEMCKNGVILVQSL
jgi:hypothetical protein